MNISPAGVELIKKHEGCRLTAYLCPAKVLTIGYGSTKDVKKGEKITQYQANQRLMYDVEQSEKCINKHVKVELNQNQFDALCSWVFNLGCGNLKRSTLLKVLNKGQYQDVPFEIKKWCYAKSVKLAGLVKRRKEEAKLFKGA